MPFEATTKGHSSTIDTLDFLEARSQLEAFNGKILGIVPFRDKWTGLNQAKECRIAIEDVKECIGELQLFPAIRESEPIKKCLTEGSLNPLLPKEGDNEKEKRKKIDLLYPFEQIVGDLNG